MTQREQIWLCAKRDLTLRTENGRNDVFLWEHSHRVARNALWLVLRLEMPKSAPLDRAALEAASLYHDAGWACDYREGLLCRGEILARPTSLRQRESAAALATASLAPHLRAAALELAVNAILRMDERPAPSLEAQVLCDAENLDEIGNLGILGMLRRHTWEGHGVEDSIRTWRWQREFRFWEARISSAFHFPVARRAADQRLSRLDSIFHEISRLHSGEDLDPPLAASDEPFMNGGTPKFRR